MSDPVPVPGRKFTYADYRTWPEDERWELIDGEAMAMTPGPGTLHQEILRRLFRQVDAFFGNGPCEVFLDPYEFRLARPGQSEDEITDVVKPYLAVVCDPSRYDAKGASAPPISSSRSCRRRRPRATRSPSAPSTSGTGSGNTGWSTPRNA
ncbi:MAG: Uma2 family endonuclease [Candidatus Riflebacteria bacterium]|nr:Uma2 family endonuclease [Candidatus Riflebacteria bacterium]